MKASQKEIINSILFLADQYDLKGYKELIKEQPAPPELVKKIVYDLFLHGFNVYDCSTESYKAYTLLRTYAIELNTNGFVEFNK